MSKRRLTKRPMVLTGVHIPAHDRDLLYVAARELGVSQSEAIRQAVRKFSADVLLRAEGSAREAEAARGGKGRRREARGISTPSSENPLSPLLARIASLQ